MTKHAIPLALLTACATLGALTACTPNTATSDSGTLTVDSSAKDCTVSTTSAPSGTLSFSVKNTSDSVTEFYLLAEDGLRIVGEVENVGPGLSRDLVVQAKPGTYFTVCKPGMVGDGVGRAKFTVTDSGKDVELAGNIKQQAAAAADNYVAYVRDQTGQLVAGTQTFVDAYLAGDDATARDLYPKVRANYERIEPVAESFGDLDPELDFREADVAPGDEWTGWHRIEKDLWPPAAAENNGVAYVPLSAAERASFAGKLAQDTQKLFDAVREADYTVSIDTIANGAIGLLDEVANGKITGEEEIWSHTDLWDFQANLQGARVAYEGVRDIVLAKDKALVKDLDAKFTGLEKQLSAYGSLDAGFVFYNTLTPSQVKALSDGVNALSEPLSRLTQAVVG